jgi:hypothetical protein
MTVKSFFSKPTLADGVMLTLFFVYIVLVYVTYLKPNGRPLLIEIVFTLLKYVFLAYFVVLFSRIFYHFCLSHRK